jgi:hypothetical protein
MMKAWPLLALSSSAGAERAIQGRLLAVCPLSGQSSPKQGLLHQGVAEWSWWHEGKHVLSAGQ